MSHKIAAPPLSGRRDERGLAAPVVVMLTGLLLVATLLGGGLGRLLVDQRRVSAAADLAALAGAAALQRGQDACAAARYIATRNDAEIVGCTVDGQRVMVRAAVTSPGMSGVLGLTYRPTIAADAHAGPVGGPDFQ